MRTALALCMVIFSFVVAAPGVAQEQAAGDVALTELPVVEGSSLIVFPVGAASALDAADTPAGDTARATVSYAIVLTVAAVGFGVVRTRPATVMRS